MGIETGIKIVGIRPGEKLHEVMINNSEVPRTHKFKDMFVIASTINKNNEETLYIVN